MSISLLALSLGSDVIEAVRRGGIYTTKQLSHQDETISTRGIIRAGTHRVTLEVGT